MCEPSERELENLKKAADGLAASLKEVWKRFRFRRAQLVSYQAWRTSRGIYTEIVDSGKLPDNKFMRAYKTLVNRMLRDGKKLPEYKMWQVVREEERRCRLIYETALNLAYNDWD
jgi:hypothetical protein